MEDPRIALNAALKDAMKNKDTDRREVIRMALNSVKQVEIDTRKEVSPEQVIEILQKEAKRRRESVEDMAKAGRTEGADQERRELAILEEFLPRQLSAEEITVIVKEVIAQVGAASAKDQNKVMGPLMARVKGLADGKLVNQIVREQLNG